MGKEELEQPELSEESLDENDAVRAMDIERGMLEDFTFWGVGVLTWTLLRRGEAITLDSLLAEGRRRTATPSGKPMTQENFDLARVGVAVATLAGMKTGTPTGMELSDDPLGPGSNSPAQ